jgi:recombination protein RecT
MTAIARTEDVQLPTAIKQLRGDLTAMESQFATALPPHIPAARFARVVMTAVQGNPKLLRCDRQSLFNALMKCAQDGLLPDGREAAIVPYGTNEETGRASADTAQYLPMVAGIRKKVRNSGALSDWNVQIVQEGDAFDYRLGDEPYIHHKPAMSGGRSRKVIAAYSIATYPDGTISREIMNADQIEDIRRKSKAQKGPWSDPVFYPEMARKTVARLHSKQLPMSTDLDRLIHRDDALYDFDRAREEGRKVERPGSAAAALDWFAEGGAPAEAEAEAVPAPARAPRASRASPASKADEQPHRTIVGEDAGEATAAAPASGLASQVPSSAAPKTEDEYCDYARAVIDEATSSDELQRWFRSDVQRKLRNAAGVRLDAFNLIDGWVAEKCKALDVG